MVIFHDFPLMPRERFSFYLVFVNVNFLGVVGVSTSAPSVVSEVPKARIGSRLWQLPGGSTSHGYPWMAEGWGDTQLTWLVVS
jgi:hypothetical protein